MYFKDKLVYAAKLLSSVRTIYPELKMQNTNSSTNNRFNYSAILAQTQESINVVKACRKPQNEEFTHFCNSLQV